MTDERTLDEHLGFAPKAVAKRDTDPPTEAAPSEEHGAYEDSWYQVLRARTGEAEED